MLTFEQMKELLEMVASNELGGVEVSDADFHFRVRGREVVVAPVATVAEGVTAPAAETAETGVSEVEASAPPVEEPGYILTSPIVGTFYTSPSPETSAYTTVGSRVEKGQVVCIVEAMKLMNEIESDVSGVLLKVFPLNAQPVEFGEPLFAIEVD